MPSVCRCRRPLSPSPSSSPSSPARRHRPAPPAAAVRDFTPESFLGFRVGTTAGSPTTGRSWIAEALARRSDRIVVDTSVPRCGRPLLMAAISSAANLREAARWREVSRRLSDPRGLTPEEAGRLVAEGKVILLVTCSIHANEIGASQMSLEWACGTSPRRRTRTCCGSSTTSSCCWSRR